MRNQSDLDMVEKDDGILSSQASSAITNAFGMLQRERDVTVGGGASLELTPMLDGTHLRCQVGQWYWPTATWLVFGLEPTNVMLPLAPGCALLVDPQIVLPILPMAFTTLPIPNIGPIELKVQGVMLEPASGLLTSQRATLTVR